ncbi:hypothetical protein HKX48_006734 [Thoreauomyces humboldtii]|nr:hypothetical protein HKX48_006734 [Thoreauomyces humboldtii]
MHNGEPSPQKPAGGPYHQREVFIPGLDFEPEGNNITRSAKLIECQAVNISCYFLYIKSINAFELELLDQGNEQQFSKQERAIDY